MDMNPVSFRAGLPAYQAQADALLHGWKTGDREAILLRFYQCKPLADVGQALGTSEEAARKRVDRAVEKLREKLADLYGDGDD